MTDMAGIPHPGHQPDGGYVLLASEQQLDCRQLGDEVEQGFKDMQQSKSRMATERTSLPPTVVGAFGRMFGGENGGLNSAKSYSRAETRVRALNQQLGAKGCHTVDVDARVAALDSMAVATAGTAAGAQAAGTSATAPKGNDLQSDIESLATAITAKGLR